MYIKVLLSIFSWLLDYYSNNSMVYAFEEVLFFDDRSTTTTQQLFGHNIISIIYFQKNLYNIIPGTTVM